MMTVQEDVKLQIKIIDLISHIDKEEDEEVSNRLEASLMDLIHEYIDTSRVYKTSPAACIYSLMGGCYRKGKKEK